MKIKIVKSTLTGKYRVMREYEITEEIKNKLFGLIPTKTKKEKTIKWIFLNGYGDYHNPPDIVVYVCYRTRINKNLPAEFNTYKQAENFVKKHFGEEGLKSLYIPEEKWEPVVK